MMQRLLWCAAGPRRPAPDGRVPQEAHRVRRGPRAGHRAHIAACLHASCFLCAPAPDRSLRAPNSKS